MATVTRSNGNAYAVVYKDASTQGADPLTADETVIFEGPAVDFFKVVIQNGSNVNVDLRGEMGATEAVEAILREVQTKGTISMYQVEGDNTGQISLAVYPTAAWTAATLQTALRAITPNSLDISGTDVTAPGFDLA